MATAHAHDHERDDRQRPSPRAVLVSAVVVIAVVVAASVALRSPDTVDAASSTGSTTNPSTTTGAPATTLPTTATTPPTTVPPTTAPPTTVPPTTVPPTTVPPTTVPPTTVPPAPPALQPGSEGPDVVALQQRLVDLGFFVPTVDGRYGSLTQQAVMAFQKSAGIGRDGVAGPVTLAALETGSPVLPREGGDHIEVDLERQLMILVRGDSTFVFNTSSGRSGWRTPTGRFTITRQIDGVRRAPLGDLYRPKYFNQGIALHGSPSIPGHAASHGCTRLHDAVVDLIWSADLAPVGTPVWVY